MAPPLRVSHPTQAFREKLVIKDLREFNLKFCLTSSKETWHSYKKMPNSLLFHLGMEISSPLPLRTIVQPESSVEDCYLVWNTGWNNAFADREGREKRLTHPPFSTPFNSECSHRVNTIYSFRNRPERSILPVGLSGWKQEPRETAVQEVVGTSALTC
jgi:hypothetical protein